MELAGRGKTFITYILTGVSCGIVCGGAAVFFSWLTTMCDSVFHAHEKLIFLLPIAGIAVVLLYDEFRKEDDLTMDALYRHMRDGRPLSFWLAPMIAVSTCLAYLTGGSVEFALLRRFAPAPELLLACGIAAGFCGILNAPVAGAVFGVEVLVLSYRKWIYIFPALITSFITWGIARAAGIYYVDFHDLTTATVSTTVVLKVFVIAFAAMLIGRMYCFVRKITVKGFEALNNRYLRVIAGTVLVIALTQILGHTNCNGIGFSYVDAALDGHSATLAFLWKLMLTAFTLGCGIRGGEIAPTLFIGATGCFAAGHLIGLDPALAAAIGIVGALASVTNCPAAIFLYGLEAISLSPGMALYFFISACMAHFLSGTGGIYSEQRAEKQILKPHLF